jgi:hypothetical protein
MAISWNVRAAFEHQPTVFLPKRHANIVYRIESGLKEPKLKSKQRPKLPLQRLVI